MMTTGQNNHIMNIQGGETKKVSLNYDDNINFIFLFLRKDFENNHIIYI